MSLLRRRPNELSAPAAPQPSSLDAPPRHTQHTTSTQATKNPRYLQAYTDHEQDRKQAKQEKELHRINHPYDTTTFDSEQRHVQEFVVRNYNRAAGANQIPLLRLGDRYVKPQLLYRTLSKPSASSASAPSSSSSPPAPPSSSDPSSYFPDPDSSDTRDCAATVIQCCFRSYSSRQRHAHMSLEHARRTRAAVRVQSRYRGHLGYAKFVLSRARSHDESDAAVLIQGGFRGKIARNVVRDRRLINVGKEDAARGMQRLYRGRNARREAELRRRERGSIIASTNAWGESDNGLALILDLSAVKSKYHFANVVTVKGAPSPSEPQKAGGRKVGWAAAPKVTPNAAEDAADNGGDEDADRLNEVKGGSASLAAQLARIELMAEQLEDDFAKTDHDLTTFKTKFDKEFVTAKETTVNSRLNLLEYENEMMKQREKQKKQQQLKTARSATGGGRFEPVSPEYLAADMEAEEDMKACWQLLKDLERQVKPGR